MPCATLAVRANGGNANTKSHSGCVMFRYKKTISTTMSRSVPTAVRVFNERLQGARNSSGVMVNHLSSVAVQHAMGCLAGSLDTSVKSELPWWENLRRL